MKKNKNIVSNIIKDIPKTKPNTLNNKYYPNINDLIGTLIGIPITGYSHFTYISEMFRNRLLSFNIENYSDYVSSIEGDENNGKNVTRIMTTDENGYLKGQNIQWNENNSSNIGQDDSITSSFDNPNSLLYKTKLLFNQKKIDSIISRFHTEGNVDTQDRGNSGLVNSNASTKRYGMSHGRNLLTKRAENGANPKTDGYENPYCRVWTHYHQYDSINKLIRPFTNEDGTTMSIGDLQSTWNFIRGENGASRLNDNTVLNKNGFVNITPSYDSNNKLKVHTKKCMFSIENLAWKGYSNYEFEKALSWEQRGPFGGRIMWFPPYDISFSENTSVNWNSDSFIGRGEKVYTYIDTDRSGTLSFKLVVDHPSIINYYEGTNKTPNVQPNESLKANEDFKNKPQNSLKKVLNEGFGNVNNESTKAISNESKDTDLLRFFAGCDTISGQAKNLTDENNKEMYLEAINPTIESNVNNELIKPEVFTENEQTSQETFVFYVYYPNNYSGINDKTGNVVEAIAYLLNGVVCQKENDGKKDGFLQFNNLKNELVSSGIGTGYEMSNEYGISHLYNLNGLYGSIKGKYTDWKYRVDNDTIDQKLSFKSNEVDEDVQNNHSKNGLNVDKSLGWDDATFTLAEIAYAVSDIDLIKTKAQSFGDFNNNITKIKNIISNNKIIKIEAEGLANSHGNNQSAKINETRNNTLAQRRAQTVIEWLKTVKPFDTVSDIEALTVHVSHVDTKSVSDIEAKKRRAAKITVTYEISNTKPLSETQQAPVEGNTSGTNLYGTNFQESKIVPYKTSEDGTIQYGSYTNPDTKITYYFERSSNGTWKTDVNKNIDLPNMGITVSNRKKDFNTIRYDQEYHFFKVLKDKNPIIWDKFTEKIKYFTPAFHSMTPEGFNSRLTFLNQCTRQGNTIGASDTNKASATNLSFGTPPICILRLGDFYNTKIVITSMNIEYDPLQWDLNSEGIGVQPLIANVNLSFNFIGGSDLNGPIARLQNAMTFNYYKNTSVYDNRSDVAEYDEDGNIISYSGYTTSLSK